MKSKCACGSFDYRPPDGKGAGGGKACICHRNTNNINIGKGGGKYYQVSSPDNLCFSGPGGIGATNIVDNVTQDALKALSFYYEEMTPDDYKTIRSALSQNVPDEPDLTLAYMAGHERGKTDHTYRIREARQAFVRIFNNIGQWLNNGTSEKKLVEEETPERAYWNGYAVALSIVINRMNFVLGDTGETI